MVAAPARAPRAGGPFLPPIKGTNGLNCPVMGEERRFADNRPPSVKVEKPWGRFEQYAHNVPCTVKIITVDPGAKVELGDEVLSPVPGEKLYIPRGTVHRLSCVGEQSVRILEVSFGEFAEDDIVRLEDVYGRIGP